MQVTQTKLFIQNEYGQDDRKQNVCSGDTETSLGIFIHKRVRQIRYIVGIGLHNYRL